MSKLPDIPFYGRIERGVLKLDQREQFARLRESLEGQEIEIRLAKRQKQRSVNQNAYLHGIVLPMIAEAAGYDRSELGAVKDALKHKFLQMPCAPGALQLVRSTADLSTGEMTNFIEDCRRWAAETFHLNIPDPQ